MGIIFSTIRQAFCPTSRVPRTIEISHPYPLLPKGTFDTQLPKSGHRQVVNKNYGTQRPSSRNSYGPSIRQSLSEPLLPPVEGRNPTFREGSITSPESWPRMSGTGSLSAGRKLRKTRRVDGGWDLWREGDWRGFKLDELRYWGDEGGVEERGEEVRCRKSRHFEDHVDETGGNGGFQQGNDDTMISATSTKDMNLGR